MCILELLHECGPFKDAFLYVALAQLLQIDKVLTNVLYFSSGGMDRRTDWLTDWTILIKLVLLVMKVYNAQKKIIFLAHLRIYENYSVSQVLEQVRYLNKNQSNLQFLSCFTPRYKDTGLWHHLIDLSNQNVKLIETIPRDALRVSHVPWQ